MLQPSRTNTNDLSFGDLQVPLAPVLKRVSGDKPRNVAKPIAELPTKSSCKTARARPEPRSHSSRVLPCRARKISLSLSVTLQSLGLGGLGSEGFPRWTVIKVEEAALLACARRQSCFSSHIVNITKINTDLSTRTDRDHLPRKISTPKALALRTLCTTSPLRFEPSQPETCESLCFGYGIGTG
jgi:hypothetical protein